MFLRRTSPFRLASYPYCRCFATTSPASFTIRKVGVDVEQLIKNKEQNEAIKKRQLESLKQKYGIKQLYAKSIAEYKAQRNQKQEKPEMLPIKLSHPLMVIDVANLMKYIHGSKYFSHPYAAKDLHGELRKAIVSSGEKPTTINAEMAPEVVPKLEVALVLEKYFRSGAFEGTVGSGNMWIRTVHALDTRVFNQYAGDDTIAQVAKRARAEGREVTVVSDDRSLCFKVAKMGARILQGKHFLQELEADKASRQEDSTIKNGAQLWTRLREVDKKEGVDAKTAKEMFQRLPIVQISSDEDSTSAMAPADSTTAQPDVTAELEGHGEAGQRTEFSQ